MKKPRKKTEFFMSRGRKIFYDQKDIDRFWSKVSIKGEKDCWEWKGRLEKNGYAKISLNGRTYGENLGVHVFSLLLVEKEIPEEMYVLHSCNNRCCVNPSHLRIGTQKENVQDSFLAGNRYASNAKITKEDALEIRNLYSNGTIKKEKLAKKYGVKRGTIHDILTGRSWKSAGGIILEPVKKLSVDDVLEIRRLGDNKLVPLEEIAKRFDRSAGEIREIIKRRVWTNI